MAEVAVESPSGVASARIATSWFDALLAGAERLPGPMWAFAVVATLVVAIPLHAAELVDGRAPAIHPDLVIGGATPAVFIWLAISLNRVALRSLHKLEPALDPAGPAPSMIAADLVRTPNVLAVPALGLAVLAGIGSVVESPQNWGVDFAVPGARLVAAFALSVATDILLFGLLAHFVHQLRVVIRVHRHVRIDLFQLEPLYAFSTLTARTGLALLALVAGLVAFLSLSIGTFLLANSTDMLLTIGIIVVGIACFIVPLLGLHGRIADVKAGKVAEAQATLAAVIEAVRVRVAEGDLEGASKLKDAMLAAESSVLAVRRISPWPWRTETLRGFVSAVLLPIGLFVTYEFLRRALD